MKINHALFRLRPAQWAGGALLIVAAGAFYVWSASGSPYGILARPDVLDDESARLLGVKDTAGSAALTRRSLDLRPLDASAWCRLAAARARQAGDGDAQVQTLLRRSYQASAIDVDAFAWRSAFIFGHWSQVDPDLRQLAANEVRALDKMWETKPQVDRAAGAVTDPDGRFALKLLRS